MFGKILKGILNAVTGQDEPKRESQKTNSYNPQPSRGQDFRPMPTPPPAPTSTPTAAPMRSNADNLYSRVANTSYIDSLRVGRSWVLPQMIWTSFDRSGTFSEAKYYQAVCSIEYNKGWKILMRNYKALSKMSVTDPVGYAHRANWWSKEVALGMARYDLMIFDQRIAQMSMKPKTNCLGGPYVRLFKLRGHTCRNNMFFLNTPNPMSRWNSSNSRTIADLRLTFVQCINAIERASSPVELYQALSDYNNHRWVYCTAPLPEPFVNAYMGDGAYSAMMTMVKYLNLSYRATRDECLADIEAKTAECGQDGRRLFRFCAMRFLDRNAGGIFDYRAYCQRR